MTGMTEMTEMTEDTSYILNNSHLDCQDLSEEADYLLGRINWWLEGVTQITITTLGVIGNSLCIFLLSRKELSNSFNRLLTCLASFDLIYLLGMFFESLQRLNGFSRLHILLYPQFLYPLNAIAMSGSIYMTVAIATERYTAVYHPMYYNRVMQDATAHKRRLLCYLLPVLFIAIFFNLPKFLESKVIYRPTANHTSVMLMGFWKLEGEPEVDITRLRLDPAYVIYYHNWARLLVLGVGPMSAIAILNLKIYLAMRSVSRRRGPRRGNEDSFTAVLMFIVITFIVCNLPRVILNMHEVHVMERVNMCLDSGMMGFPMWTIVLGFVSHILLVINSSANLFIYCAVGAKFREVALIYFTRVFKCKCVKRRFEAKCSCLQSTEHDGVRCLACGNIRAGFTTYKNSSVNNEGNTPVITPRLVTASSYFEVCDKNGNDNPTPKSTGYHNSLANPMKLHLSPSNSNHCSYKHTKPNSAVTNGNATQDNDDVTISPGETDKLMEETSFINARELIVHSSMELEESLPDLDFVDKTAQVLDQIPERVLRFESNSECEKASSMTELIVVDPVTIHHENKMKETAF